MGRGNFCPSGELTDQWYIDYDVYRFDPEDENNFDVDYDLCQEDVRYLMREIQKKFPSFKEVDKWKDHYWNQHALLENSFFEIGTADNEWAMAIYIKEKDDIWDEHMNLASRHFENYTKGIQDILLDAFGTIYTRNGPWMSSRLTREAA